MTDQTNPPSAGVAAEPLSVEQRLANLYGAQERAPAPPPPQAKEAPEPPVQADAAEQDADQAELSPDDLPDDPESSSAVAFCGRVRDCP